MNSSLSLNNTASRHRSLYNQDELKLLRKAKLLALDKDYTPEESLGYVLIEEKLEFGDVFGDRDRNAVISKFKKL